MQRVIGMDIHRTFAEVVFWEAGRLRSGLEPSRAQESHLLFRSIAVCIEMSKPA